MEDTIFAILTPANTLTKLAFDDFVEVNIAGLHKGEAKGALASLRITVEPQRKYDREAFLLRAQLTQRDAFDGESNAGDSSETLPEPETEIEDEYREYGMIWEGCFVLAFKPQPSKLRFGWTVGKRVLGNNGPANADLLLCTRSFEKKHGIHLRNFHARLNFNPHTRGFSVALASRRPNTHLTVDGDGVSRSLNTGSCTHRSTAAGSLKHSAIG